MLVGIRYIAGQKAVLIKIDFFQAFQEWPDKIYSNK